MKCGQRLTPFEVKASVTVTAQDTRGILRWLELSGSAGNGMVIYAGNDVKPLNRRVWAVPLLATSEYSGGP